MTVAESIRRTRCRHIMRLAWRYYRRARNIDFTLALKVSWLLISGKQRPCHSKVRGVSFGNRQRVIQSLVGLDDGALWLEFVREPDNPIDDSAILIRAYTTRWNKGHDIGYVSYDLSQLITPVLDAGGRSIVLLNDITGQRREGGLLGVNYEYVVIQ